MILYNVSVYMSEKDTQHLYTHNRMSLNLEMHHKAMQ